MNTPDIIALSELQPCKFHANVSDMVKYPTPSLIKQ